MTAFHVTYETVTPESAEDGDAAERGFYSRGGWRHDDPSDWTLHEVVAEFGRHALVDGGRWFSTADGETNYRTGDATNYSVHPPTSITPASYARLRRVLA